MEKELSLVAEYNEQGRSLYAVDKYDEALKMYKKAEEEDPMYIETYLNMGELYIMQDKFEEAKKELKKVFLVDKTNGEANFHLGNIAYITGEPEAARSFYTKALSNGYNNAVVTYHLGCLYLDMGDLKNALFYFNKTIKADYFNSAARLRKIELLIANESFDDAIKACDELIEVHPDTFEGYHYKFITLLGLEKPEEANNVLELAMELFPEDLGFVYDKIKYYENIEDYDKALALIDERFTSDSDDWRSIRKEKAKILFTMERLEDAKNLFEEILSEEFDDEMCYCLMHLYIGYEKYDKVLECCSKIIENKGENDYYYSAIYFEAVCNKKMGNDSVAFEKFKEAQKTFRFACSSNPGNLVLYLYRALCYKELKQYDRGLEMVEYILNMSDGTIGEAYYVRSQIYAELGDETKAKADKEKALSLSKVLTDVIM